MRRLVLSSPLAVALLSACSGGSSDPVPLFDGFVPQGAGAVVFAPTVCEHPFLGTISVSGVAVVLSSDADVCGTIATTRLCGTRASSTTVLGVALRGDLGGGGVADADPATYRFLPNEPTGPFRAATGDALEAAATCDPVTGGNPDFTGGQVVLASVGAENVTGSMRLSFGGNQVFAQDFDVPVCPVSVDLCTLVATGCFDYACVP
jgi:hypothetical protein